MKKRGWFNACALAATLVIAACKTAPAPDSGFLANPERMTAQRGRAPFDRAWVKQDFVRSAYTSLMISKVNTDFLMENTGWDAANPASKTLSQSAEELAQFTRDTFVRAFSTDPRRRFKIVDRPGPGVATLDLAIVELVPSKAVLGALGLAAPFAKAPLVAIGSKAAGGNTCVAIEGRLRDSFTGETLMMFADREEPPFRILDAKAVTWYGDAKDSIKTWAKQLVELANTPKETEVKDAPNFTLKPW
ncbi:MAG: DUF3313 domain-containing protein [bacterium]